MSASPGRVGSWNRTSGSSELEKPQRSDLTPNRYRHTVPIWANKNRELPQ